MEPVSTQVIHRDRHAELLQAIALAGAGLESLATEIRHLQRTEVREVEEPFARGAEGLQRDAAQAQPDHDASGSRGLARVLRGNAQTGARERRAVARARHLALGAERVILPDATILLDYMLHGRYAWVIEGWSSTPSACAATSISTHGALFSQWVLLALVDAGHAAR